MKDNCFTVLCSFHQHEPAIYIYPLSPGPPSPPHPSRSLQSPILSSLSYIANSHWLSVICMVMSVCMLLSPHILPSPSSTCTHHVLKSVLCVCLHCCPANNFLSTWVWDFDAHRTFHGQLALWLGGGQLHSRAVLPFAGTDSMTSGIPCPGQGVDSITKAPGDSLWWGSRANQFVPSLTHDPDLLASLLDWLNCTT